MSVIAMLYKDIRLPILIVLRSFDQQICAKGMQDLQQFIYTDGARITFDLSNTGLFQAKPLAEVGLRPALRLPQGLEVRR